MKHCYGYVRVSTAKQGEGVSLVAQREAIEHFAARNGITIIEWFEEKDTAAKSGRPVFNAMIRLLKLNRADGVVMHKIDRSARNFADWAKIGDLSDAGIDVHFATESLDFRSRGGRLSADIQAVIAADYIRNLREEIKKGIYGRLRQGLYPFGAPIGYLDQGAGNQKIPDPIRAPLLRRAFELYSTGNYSLHSLREELSQLGLRNRNGHPLTKGGLETVLDNPFYCGVIRIRKTGATYEGSHEPLISAGLFRAVQAVRANRAGKKVTLHRHTYRGLFRCRNCGLSMIPERQKGHVYYRCQQRECPSNCVREEALERAVTEMLGGVVLSPQSIAEITAAVDRWASRHSETLQLRTANFALQAVERRLDNLTDALIDRLIDNDTFNRRKEALLLQQTELREKLETIAQYGVNPQMVQAFLERTKNLAEHYIFAEPEEKRQIVDIVTSNRTVARKNVELEPSEWLKPAHTTLGFLSGAPRRPTSRRGSKLRDDQIETLVTAARSPEWARLAALMEGKKPGLTPLQSRRTPSVGSLRHNATKLSPPPAGDRDFRRL